MSDAPPITDSVRQLVHETDDFQMSYELMLAYHFVLTNPGERQHFLNWLERNDSFFEAVKRSVLRELGNVTEAEMYQAVVIVLARQCRRLINLVAKGGAK